MIITVTLNPAVDKTVTIPNFTVNKVNRIEDIRQDPGGKGINVSKVVSALGSESIATGFLGGTTGSYILSSLNTAGIKTNFQHIACETRTNLKVVDSQKNTYTDINEPGPPITKDELSHFEDKLFSLVHEEDLVIFSGGAPKDVPTNKLYEWPKRCKQLGAFVYTDLDGELSSKAIKSKPFFVKPNDTELEHLLGVPMKSQKEIIKGATTLLEKGIERVVVSLGAKGALFATKEQILIAENLRVTVRSTVGAGDSMLAAFAWSHLQGLNWEESIRWAMATANAKVTCEGSSPPNKKQIEEYYHQINIATL